MKKRVVFIHPDLGVGGAERLMIDAAKALQNVGNDIEIYTAHHDKNRCFEETRDGTLKVITVGAWIPMSILGRCHAILAYLKIIYIALYLIISWKDFDVVFCDQVSACIPILKLRNMLLKRPPKIIFYCHFPDQLLTTRESLIKKIYRTPIDRFEEWSTRLADLILVNSGFTKNIVKRTFKSLINRDLAILYPCVDVSDFQKRRPSADECDAYRVHYPKLRDAKFILLSINRFERKKDLGLAIRQFKLLQDEITQRNHSFDRYQLIIAGGYDERLEDCVRYYEELEKLSRQCGLQSNITFIKSLNDREKLILLEICDALVYTPQNEHFGIVPIEAMAMRKPVISCASGGPLETIEHNVCGFLSEPELIHHAMIKLASDKTLCRSMGDSGYENVLAKFSFETFQSKLNKICCST